MWRAKIKLEVIYQLVIHRPRSQIQQNLLSSSLNAGLKLYLVENQFKQA